MWPYQDSLDINTIGLVASNISFKKQRMVQLKFRGSDLADLDFWSKSDPFLVLSRPRRHGHGLQQVSLYCIVQTAYTYSVSIRYGKLKLSGMISTLIGRYFTLLPRNCVMTI